MALFLPGNRANLRKNLRRKYLTTYLQNYQIAVTTPIIVFAFSNQALTRAFVHFWIDSVTLL